MNTAYNDILVNDSLELIPSCLERIRAQWDAVRIECGGDDCDDIDGAWNGTRLLMCALGELRVRPVLLHELVHVTGGKELDSEAVEHACFNGQGATVPNKGDWGKFKDQTEPFGGSERERVARYVIWNSTTGEVWVRVEVDGKPAKGTRLFQSPHWVHRYALET